MPMTMQQAVHVPVEPMELGDNEADAAADDPAHLPMVDQADHQLPVVNSAPVDVDQLTQQYTGHALMQRLLFVADRCPPLRRDALTALIQYVQNTFNVSMYQQAHAKLASSQADSNGHSTAPPDVAAADPQRGPAYDQTWVEQQAKRAQLKLEKLDTDLKHYKNNSIKESIRRGQDDLGEHYLDMGNLSDALKCFNRARDYCTSCKHVVQMCFNVIKVSAYLNNWSLVSAYVSRAENSGDLATAGGSKDVVQQRSTAVAKLRAAAGLAELALKKYRAAARNFLQVSFDHLDYAELIAPRDIAVYGTLCALATYDRSELQRNVMQNTGFKQFLELEPQLNELIVRFNDSAYGACLAIMDGLRDSLLLDLHLAPHVRTLYLCIRNRGLVQYLSPYLSADMNLMAQAFNTSVARLEDELTELILKGDIKARIDSHAKTLHAKDVDQRTAAYERSLAVGRALEQRAKAVVLRAAVQRAKVCVRAPPRNGASAAPMAPGLFHYAAHGSGLGNNNADNDFGDTPGNSGQSSPQ